MDWIHPGTKVNNSMADLWVKWPQFLPKPAAQLAQSEWPNAIDRGVEGKMACENVQGVQIKVHR
jgi:hypothetical protein